MLRPASAALVVAVRALPLPPDRGAAPALPEWALDALRARPAAWPEERDRSVLEVVAGDGSRGQSPPCSPAVVDLVRDQLVPGLLGADCFAYRSLEQLPLAGRHRTGAHLRIAQSAVELALWDLRSRLAGTPVVRLLGGPVRTEVPCYASALGVDVDHPLAPDIACWLATKGYAGQKWSLPGFALGEEPSADAARLERLRAAVGADCALMIDARGEWSADYLRRMAAPLAACGIAWLEEPVGDGSEPPSGELRRAAGAVPLAAGEHAYDLAAQLRWLRDGAIDVWQPDVGWHGGIVQTLRMVDLAAALGVRVFPHGGCLAGALVVAALTSDAVLPAVEYHLTMEPVRQAPLADPLTPVDGCLTVRGAPGLWPELGELDGAAIDLGALRGVAV